MGKDKLLFVEGVNDREVIYRLENVYGIKGICTVKACSSVDSAKLEFALAINENATKVATAGIVIDADVSEIDRWKSLRNLILETGRYDVPVELPVSGLVLSPKIENAPKVGVWLMPNNKSNGMLEDFLLFLAKNDTDMLSFVDHSIDDLSSAGLKRFSDSHYSKARVHTYLAWQKEPGCSLASAIEKKYFDADNELAKKFVCWMKSLFNV